jgi:hypothetical protein
MAQLFNNAVLTDGGAAMVARAQAEGLAITFSSVACGNGTYTDKSVNALKVLTALKSQKQSFPISGKSRQGANAVKLSAVLTNIDLSVGYYMNEIGVMAHIGSDADTLFSIAVTAGDQGDFFPPYNGSSPAEIMQSFVVTFANETTVNITMASDIYALKAEVGDLDDLVTEEKHTIVGAINEAAQTGVSERVYALETDVANMAFQLALDDLIDTSDFKTVAVDEIDSADAVTIVSGQYDNLNQKVYI